MTWLPKETVIVPVDFSGEGVRAVRTALELVAKPSDVHALHVMDPPDYAAYGFATTPVDNLDREQNIWKHFDNFVEQNEFPDVNRALRTGNAGIEIAQYAEDVNADLIVIPSHGYHGVKRLLLGSVAERVLRLASCPVLVLRRSDADATDEADPSTSK